MVYGAAATAVVGDGAAILSTTTSAASAAAAAATAAADGQTSPWACVRVGASGYRGVVPVGAGGGQCRRPSPSRVDPLRRTLEGEGGCG